MKLNLCLQAISIIIISVFDFLISSICPSTPFQHMFFVCVAATFTSHFLGKDLVK